jgi:hypothetical protein
MKRILRIIAVIIGALIFTVWGNIQEHPAIMYIGIIIGCFLGIALTAFIFKSLWKLIGVSITSIFFLVLISGILFTLSWHGIINSALSYGIGIIIGLLLILIVIRWLASKSYNSILFGEIFGFITGYKLKAFVSKGKLDTKENLVSENNDYNNIKLILIKQMGFSKKEAIEATDYAVENVPLDASIEDKIKQALQYQGKNN